MRLQHHAFGPADLIGGDLAVDFVNTVTARTAEPRDRLDSYAALIRWAEQTGGFSRTDLARLGALARRRPAGARAALARCRRLREALCGVLYALARRRAPGAEALAVIDQARVAAAKACRLAVRGARVRPEWPVERCGLDTVRHVITAHALDLLRDVRLDRLRVCDGSDCGWLFVDQSKNGRRRWCDMTTCGNVAKARRFRAGR